MYVYVRPLSHHHQPISSLKHFSHTRPVQPEKGSRNRGMGWDGIHRICNILEILFWDSWRGRSFDHVRHRGTAGSSGKLRKTFALQPISFYQNLSWRMVCPVIREAHGKESECRFAQVLRLQQLGGLSLLVEEAFVHELAGAARLSAWLSQIMASNNGDGSRTTGLL